MNVERIGPALVFRAGKGEWYNQRNPGWDMGEEPDLPPAPWHIALEEAIATHDSTALLVVIDVTEMIWLEIFDWAFLLRLHRSLAAKGRKISVVATGRVLTAARIIKIADHFEVGSSLDDALRSA